MFYDVDFHVHTTFSDGEGCVKDVLAQANEKGLRAIAITDHFDPHNSLELEQGIIKLKKHVGHIRKQANLSKINVFVGVEASVPVTITKEINDMLDFIIRSVHSFPEGTDFSKYSLYDPEIWDIYKNEVLKLFSRKYTDVAGHIMGYFPFPAAWIEGLSFAERRELEKKIRDQYFDKEWQDNIIEEAIKNNVAIEIHNPTAAPYADFVKRAIASGVKISLGSDAHLLDWVGKVEYGRKILLDLNIREDNLFWPGDD